MKTNPRLDALSARWRFQRVMMFLTDIPFALDAGQLLRELPLDSAAPEAAEIRRAMACAQQIARPRALLVAARVATVQGDQIRIGPARMVSRLLACELAPGDVVHALLATCGQEMDQNEPDQADPLLHYVWERLKEVLLQIAVAYARETLCRQQGVDRHALLMPGGGERMVWPIEQQRELFRLFGAGAAAIGVTLNSDMLMTPGKSLSGVLFATTHAVGGCAVSGCAGCRCASCGARRTGLHPDGNTAGCEASAAVSETPPYRAATHR